MQPSLNAADLIASHADTLVEQFEGDILKAYQDQNGIWTIGYGHTGPEVHEGLVWTQQQATAALRQDMLRSGDDILRLITVPLNQNEFDALDSFDYNIGPGHLSSSTALRKLNAGDRQGAADAMLLWDVAGGKVSRGLLRRRQAERSLFLTPVSTQSALVLTQAA